MLRLAGSLFVTYGELHVLVDGNSVFLSSAGAPVKVV